MDLLRAIILDPQYHDVLTILKGARNGIVYGAKVRFPHALVMTFMFKSGSLKSKLKNIFMATKQHAQNLGMFATIYKTVMLLLRNANQGKQEEFHAFIAGAIGGLIVFKDNKSINQQIILYLFSRVAVALVKLPVHKNYIKEPKHTFPIFAAVVWGIVMWLFQHDDSTLQSSLRSSMVYIYRDSDHWTSLKTLLWHNK
ncbi:peroxisomal membrane protein 4-like protein [Spinellus fusiger]|nr:peroxisomal membrane protein 4-like protein [Spinellus fusiger]